MYCPDCREERRGKDVFCALCGSRMAERSRAVVEAELAHVHFLLGELPRWELSDVPLNARRFILERYERQARILLAVLTELPQDGAEHVPAPALDDVTATHAEQVTPPEPAVAAAVEAAASAVMATALEAEAPTATAAHAEPPSVPSEATAQNAEAESVRDEGPFHGFEPTPEMPAEATARAAEPRTEETGAERHETFLPLPPNPAEPYAEPPQPRSLTARLVEETSTWNRVWRPFLYESIMWFVGAFLILSGTLYFVFESWAGMSSSVRSLTVFGMTAGYSAGFAVWGAFLARREALRKPGHILGLIGAAVAPLAGIALGPLGLGDLFQLGGVGTGLLVPALVVWSGVAAFLARKPLEAIDAPSRPFIQLALVASTWMMGLAPLAARLGDHALWLDVLPCALYFLMASRPAPTPREDTSLAFVIAAPLYLLFLYFARLHVALAGAEVEVSVGAYAPFCAFLLATALRFRTLDSERGADGLSIGAVSLQAACLIAASLSPPPTFFVTAAVMAWTLVSLARGGLARVRWAYAAYAALYFAYASFSQLFPGLALRWLNVVRDRFGYAVTEPLPLQFGALSALPFIFAGAVFAVSRLWRGERAGNPRDSALAEVLLRATAGASVLFIFLSITGPDARPAFWSALALAVLCLTLGLLVERFFLTVVGAGLCLFLPFQALAVLGASRGSVAAGAMALVLAAVALVCTARTRQLLGVIVGVMSLVGFLMGLAMGSGFTAVTGIALCAAAAVLTAWSFQSPVLVAMAAVLAAAVVPSLAGEVASKSVAPALAVTALGLALLSLRGGLVRWVGLPAVFYALLAVPWGMLAQVPGLGVVILVAAGAVAVASRVLPWVRPMAVGIASLALIQDISGIYSPWGGWMSPGLSVTLFCGWALGASVISARWGRSVSTVVAGLIALVFPLTALIGADSSLQSRVFLGAAFAALLTARALPATLSVVMAAFYAVFALSAWGGVGLLGLAAVLSLLAVLEEVPWVSRVCAGGARFALAASLCAAGVLGMVVVKWDDAPLPLLLAGTGTLPLLWTRATRQPFFASLAVPYSFVSIVVVGGELPGWVQALPVLALVLVRAVAHVPVVASLLLRSREEAPRNALSLWVQGWLAVAMVVMDIPALGSAEYRTPLYVLAASVALMPGPLPFIRVCGAALALLPFPVARSTAMGLLLALAIAESHWPERVWAFFRSGRDAALRLACVGTALAMAVLPTVEAPTPANLGVLAGVLALSAFLLSNRWLLAPAVWALALAPMGAAGLEDLLFRRDGDGLSSFVVALGAAALAAVCQVGAIQRGLTRAFAKVLPPLEDSWSEPLWVGGAGALGALLVQRVLTSWAGTLSLPVTLVAVATSCLLMVARERWMANVATGLLGVSLVAAVDPLWLPAILGGVGLALCLLGMWLDTREVRVGASLHHGGWVLSLLSLTAIRELGHAGMPLSLLFALGATWAVVYRRRERELLGWLASLVAVHGLLIHLGVVFSSGRGAAFLLPYFGAGSALLAALALFVAGKAQRQAVGFGFTVVALLEVVTGLAFVDASLGALREGLVSSVSLGVLLIALVRRAAVEKEASSAYLAQGVLALGYLSVRMLGMGATPVAGDSLAALVGGALFTGLYFFVQREGSTLACFRGPAVLGAYLFPLAGLLSAPWRDPLDAAALLVGHAAHFAALASHPARRTLASLVSVVAFNVALVLVWQWTGEGRRSSTSSPRGSRCSRCCACSEVPSMHTPTRGCVRWPSRSSTWRGRGSRSCSAMAAPCCCVSSCVWWAWRSASGCASAPTCTWAPASW
ncbi:hypothetical protein A176_000462 [Myxococcus hansupus]|uniref:Uncharacterized protein n=1 Tax=Pseudomyxococcus hansupus TaxID=1297742 RepID=A0A0H4WQG1_9BACT|nr:hypothetical protein [Myxococcus hansupus]AKQ63550.1 hypothetical protein A176_000462 [Myxococcus hansupus]